MVDKTAGPLESALHFSKASVKVFIVSRALLSQVMCRSSPSLCHYLPYPCSLQTSKIFKHIQVYSTCMDLRLDIRLQYHRIYCISCLSWSYLLQMGSVGCIKPEILTIFIARSQKRLHNWSSGMLNCKLLSYLFSAKLVLYFSSLSFWRYNQLCCSFGDFCVWSVLLKELVWKHYN